VFAQLKAPKGVESHRSNSAEDLENPKFHHERYGKPIPITENGMAWSDTVSPDGHVHDRFAASSSGTIAELFAAP
jgi:hypothetical protein